MTMSPSDRVRVVASGLGVELDGSWEEIDESEGPGMVGASEGDSEIIV